MGKLIYSSSLRALSVFAVMAIPSLGISANLVATAAGGDWNTASTWVPAQIPVFTDNCTVGAGSNVTISSTAYCHNLDIQPGGTVNKNYTFYVGGTLNVDGSFTGVGSLNFNGAGMIISGTALISAGGLYTVGGSLTINAGTVIDKNAGFLLATASSVTNLGSVTLGAHGGLSAPAGSTWTNGNGSSLTLDGTISGGGTFDFSAPTNTVTYSLDATSIAPANPSYYNLVLANSTSNKSLGGNVTVINNVTINSGVTLAGAGFTMTVGGNWVNSNSTFNLTNVDIIFNGSSVQTISKNGTEGFRDVTVSNVAGGSVQLLGQLNINRNLFITSGTLDVGSSNNAMQVYGNWSNTGGTFTARNGLVHFVPPPATTLTVNKVGGPETFNAVNVENGGTVSLTSDISLIGRLNIYNGTLNCGANTINIGGTWNNMSTWVPSTGTVNFNGPGNIQVLYNSAGPETFNNFKVNGASTYVMLSSDIQVNGAFTLSAGTLDINTSLQAVNIGGNATFSSTFVQRTGTVTLNGAAAQTMTGTIATTFYNLTHSNAAGTNITGGTFTISNALTSTSGVLNNSGGTVTIPSTAVSTAYIANGAGGYAGNFNLQRYVTGRAANWQDFASPASNANLISWDNTMYMSGVGGSDGTACCPTFYSVNTWSEASEAVVNVTTETALTPMVGYEIWTADDQVNWNAKAITTVGTPNFGNQMVNLTFNAGADAGDNRIGNPYASHITWNSALGVNVQATIYILQNGSYVGYGNGTDLPSHQGFLCYANAGGGSVTFTEASKNVSTTSTWGRMPAPYNLALKLSSPGLTDYYQENFLNFDDNATLGFDNDIDAHYVKSPEKFAPQLCMVAGNLKLTRNHFSATANETVTIPVKTTVGLDGTYTLEAMGAYAMTEYSCALLEDLQAHKVIDLKQQPQYSYYAKSTDNPDRFVLHLSRKSLDCEKVLAAGKPADMFFTDNQVTITSSQSNANIAFDLDQATTARVSVYNLLGQNVSGDLVVDAYKETMHVALPADATGIYIVNVNLGGNHMVTKKILINRQD